MKPCIILPLLCSIFLCYACHAKRTESLPHIVGTYDGGMGCYDMGPLGYALLTKGYDMARWGRAYASKRPTNHSLLATRHSPLATKMTLLKMICLHYQPIME